MTEVLNGTKLKPNAVILADSINTNTETRITTFMLPRFPKCLLAELNTHRMFSRNAASSRAIPFAAAVKSLHEDAYIPTWAKAKKGMGGTLITEQYVIDHFNEVHIASMHEAIRQAGYMKEMGAAKENYNRYLEPYLRWPVLVTSTDWGGFFELRVDAYDEETGDGPQYDFYIVAKEMRDLMHVSEPDELEWGQWHLPFGDINVEGLDVYGKMKVLTARAARVSYSNFDGGSSVESDFNLHDRLLAMKHMSPFEHCAVAMPAACYFGNLAGWASYRYHLEKNLPIG